MEDELRRAGQGHAPAWLEGKQAVEPGTRGAEHGPASVARQQAARLEAARSSGALEPPAEANNHLQSHILARLAQARRTGATVTLEEILLEATQGGVQSLAIEAGNLLGRLGTKAEGLGGSPDITLTATCWDDNNVGRGTATVLGQQWEYRDYKDR